MAKRKRLGLMMSGVIGLIAGSAALVGILTQGSPERPSITPSPSATGKPTATPIPTPFPISKPGDVTIPALRAQQYPGGPLQVERVVADTPQFTKYAVRYPSNGLSITALLAVPKGPGPFPAVILNHGYYLPSVYRPGDGTDREMDWLSGRGFLTLAPDYRNHAGSTKTEGDLLDRLEYPVDVLNAAASLRADARVRPDRIGIWGHSMGGEVTQRSVTVRPEWFRSVVLYGSMHGDEGQNIERIRFWRAQTVTDFEKRFGAVASQPQLIAELSARSYDASLTMPLQIHHATTDEQVPYGWAEERRGQLTAAGHPPQFFAYPGAPHILQGAAWQDFVNRVTDLFTQTLKS